MSSQDIPIDLTPNTYLDYALQCANENHTLQALNYMDLAISVAEHKHLFIFQKIAHLYHLRLYEQCTDCIILHFSYLYKYSSLYVFAQVLYYYQQCTHCLAEELSHLLDAHDIPLLLASLYTKILNRQGFDFTTLAKNAYTNDEFTLCIEYAHLAFKEEGFSTELLCLQGIAYENLGDLEHAIWSYKESLRLNPHLVSSHLALAQIYEHTEDFADAHYHYAQLLMQNPQNIEYLIKNADCLFKWEKISASMHQFRHIIDLDPDNSYAYLRLGEIFELLHKPRVSKKYYNKARKLNKKKHLSLKQRILKFT